MISIDKFGRKIYNTTFSKMLNIGRVLIDCGYCESSTKPNLFWKQVQNGKCYADMRGTQWTPIWEECSPLFYAFDISNDEIIKELKLLYDSGCKFRYNGCYLECYECCKPAWKWKTDGIGDIVDDELVFDYQHQVFKTKTKKVLFCSRNCMEMYIIKTNLENIYELRRNTCPICNKIKDSMINHHTEYYPNEITIHICRSCHAKIHNAYRWKLKPKIDRKTAKNLIREEREIQLSQHHTVSAHELKEEIKRVCKQLDGARARYYALYIQEIHRLQIELNNIGTSEWQ